MTQLGCARGAKLYGAIGDSGVWIVTAIDRLSDARKWRRSS